MNQVEFKILVRLLRFALRPQEHAGNAPDHRVEQRGFARAVEPLKHRDARHNLHDEVLWRLSGRPERVDTGEAVCLDSRQHIYSV